MDSRSNQPTSRHHKRSFQEMSQADLSPAPPSPNHPRSQQSQPRNPNWLNPNSPQPRIRNRAPSNSNPDTIAPSALNRSRTSNPRSPPPPIPPPRARPGPSAVMSGNSRPQPRAVDRQHVIDLTEDLDGPEEANNSPQRNRLNPNGGRARRPPQFERRDASLLDNIVDLTDDMDDEIMITGARQLPAVGRGNQHGHGRGHIRRRQESPSLFLPTESQPPNHPLARAFHNPLQAVRAVFGFIDRPGNPHEAIHAQHAHQAAQDFYQEIQRIGIHGMGEPFQNMPNMNYANPAIRNRKPEHIPPPPAREGFTRSPKEDDVVVCPSCDEELVQIKDGEVPVAKKGSKTPTKKDREEHPFWVVKECGHVYCNKCFQHRIQHGKAPHEEIEFRETDKTTKNGKTTKVILCSVEDCESEVKSRDKWLGVFL